MIFPDGSVPDIQHEANLLVRSGYDPWIHRVILQSLLDNQVVVNIGSGNMALDDPCIIRMDVTLNPYVDLVADAHALPFLPESVDYIFSLAVFEHLRNPFLAAQSMYEVLKDGGYMYHECNFVFPYHGYPHHYFNASLQGLEQVFAHYVPLRKGVATYQMPSFALDIVLRFYLRYSHAADYPHGRLLADQLQKIIDLDLVPFDIYFSEAEALHVAAGTYFAGMKQTTPNSTLIPAVIHECWQRDRRKTAPISNINDLTTTANIMAWALQEGRAQYPEIDSYLTNLERFNKRGEDSPWNRDHLRSLPWQEARFGAIDFDPDVPMAVNAQIALERSGAKICDKERLVCAIAKVTIRHPARGTRRLRCESQASIFTMKSPLESKNTPEPAAEPANFPGLDYDFLRYMGVRPEIMRQIQGFYLPYFADCRRVIDLGCGDGDFLALLLEKGIEAVGVDSDEKAFTAGKQKGLPIIQAGRVYIPARTTGGKRRRHLLRPPGRALALPKSDRTDSTIFPGVTLWRSHHLGNAQCAFALFAS